jgi:hypothetical protein
VDHSAEVPALAAHQGTAALPCAFHLEVCQNSLNLFFPEIDFERDADKGQQAF